MRLSSSPIKNQGTVASGPFRFGVYLSTDSVITTSDTFLNFASHDFNLAAGAEQGFGGVNVTIPPGTPPGSYFIGILADDTNRVNEANKNNNYVSAPITVTPNPASGRADLMFVSSSLTVTPTVVAPGGSVRLSSSPIKNQGTVASGPFRFGVYLSTDSVITTSDTFLNFASHDFNLAAGAEQGFGGVNVTIPPGTPPGSYFIGILADDTNRVNESTKNNNYVSTPITIRR